MNIKNLLMLSVVLGAFSLYASFSPEFMPWEALDSHAKDVYKKNVLATEGRVLTDEDMRGVKIRIKALDEMLENEAKQNDAKASKKQMHKTKKQLMSKNAAPGGPEIDQ